VHDIKRRGTRQVVGVLKSTVRCTVSVRRTMENIFSWFWEPRLLSQPYTIPYVSKYIALCNFKPRPPL
jgi:hypothetical protein